MSATACRNSLRNVPDDCQVHIGDSEALSPRPAALHTLSLEQNACPSLPREGGQGPTCLPSDALLFTLPSSSQRSAASCHSRHLRRGSLGAALSPSAEAWAPLRAPCALLRAWGLRNTPISYARHRLQISLWCPICPRPPRVPPALRLGPWTGPVAGLEPMLLGAHGVRSASSQRLRKGALAIAG